MLQLMDHAALRQFNYAKIAHLKKYLPPAYPAAAGAGTCTRCSYVNSHLNNFCTNCGYPLRHGHIETLYQVRSRQRAETKRKSARAVYAARLTLYIIAGFALAGIGFFFNEFDSHIMLGILSLICSVLFFSIARWSLHKPFTALLTAFVIVLTFSTIFIFGEFTNTITTVKGVYTIIVSTMLVYFLLRGVQGAYKADLINEETHIG